MTFENLSNIHFLLFFFFFTYSPHRHQSSKSSSSTPLHVVRHVSIFIARTLILDYYFSDPVSTRFGFVGLYVFIRVFLFFHILFIAFVEMRGITSSAPLSSPRCRQCAIRRSITQSGCNIVVNRNQQKRFQKYSNCYQEPKTIKN